MTREEQVAKMAELRANAEEVVSAYNEAYQEGKFEDAYKANAAIDEIVNEYTSIARDICFDECKSAEDPMVEAVKRLSFATISVKDEKRGDEKIPVRVIVEKDKKIDLLKLHKAVAGGIGSDKSWPLIAEKLNFLLTAQKAVDLGIDPAAINDSYAMSEIAKAIDMGKSPTSKTNMLRTLQVAITAMLGDEAKATSHDVNFLLSVYSSKNRKALTVTCANHKYLRGYLAEICHRIITGKSYAVEFKAIKQ